MSTENLNFIVIDDSKLDCFIAEKIIKNTGRCENIQTFQLATEALNVIKQGNSKPTIMFVDIQMPMMNGFEFVEAFEALDDSIKSKYTIYMLSSSINENDIAKVKGYASVKRFLNKPLTNTAITSVLEEN